MMGEKKKPKKKKKKNKGAVGRKKERI